MDLRPTELCSQTGKSLVPRYQVSLTSNEVSKGKASPTTNNGSRPRLALMQLLKGPANATALIFTSRTNITGRSYPSHWCTHWHLQLTRYSLCFFSCCFLSLPVAPPPCFCCPPHEYPQLFCSSLHLLLLPRDYLVPEPRIGIATLEASSTLLVSPAGSTFFFPHMLFPELLTDTAVLFPFRHQSHSGSACPPSLQNLHPLHPL